MLNTAQMNQFKMSFTYLPRMSLCITFSSRLFGLARFLSLLFPPTTGFFNELSASGLFWEKLLSWLNYPHKTASACVWLLGLFHPSLLTVEAFMHLSWTQSSAYFTHWGHSEGKKKLKWLKSTFAFSWIMTAKPKAAHFVVQKSKSFFPHSSSFSLASCARLIIGYFTQCGWLGGCHCDHWFYLIDNDDRNVQEHI